MEKKCKPVRLFPLVKSCLNEKDIQSLLTFNAGYLNRRTKFDRRLTQTLIMTFEFSGIWRQEAMDLRLSDVNLADRVLIVRLGKGNKRRLVGINQALAAQLKIWLKNHPKAKSDRFFVQANGLPLTPSVVTGRFQKLSKPSGFSFSAHNFRIFFITNNLTSDLDALEAIRGS